MKEETKSRIIGIFIVIAIIIAILFILVILAGCVETENIENKGVCIFTIEQHYGDSIIYGNQSFYVNQHPKLVIYFRGYEERIEYFNETEVEEISKSTKTIKIKYNDKKNI